ncbi:Agamous-like MADS-box protein AGL80 [Morella rubra]|uniref:Agamous-like MADS-box protein AGL80 n=1 Tax=Morella rubra TaxID=262757 RepID=A0A6A1WI65_9ROSI|nr:Agamous-like MADS-box protein AGL80 [Morella rubra]
MVPAGVHTVDADFEKGELKVKATLKKLPEVWPSPLGVQRVIATLKKLPEAEQSKKMVNQESFLRNRITKAEEQLRKQQRENRERKMTQVMYRSLVGEGLQNLSVVDLNELGWLIDSNIREIEEAIKSFRDKMPPPQVVKVTTSSYANHSEKNVMSAKNPFGMAVDGTKIQQGSVELMKPNEIVGFGSNVDIETQNHQWLMELLKQNENLSLARTKTCCHIHLIVILICGLVFHSLKHCVVPMKKNCRCCSALSWVRIE